MSKPGKQKEDALQRVRVNYTHTMLAERVKKQRWMGKLYTHTHTQQTGKSKSVEGNRKLSYKPDADTSE